METKLISPRRSVFAGLFVLLFTVVLAQNVPIYRDQGGAAEHIGSGGTLTVESGGVLDVASGGALKIAGTTVSATAAELNKGAGVTAGTVTASKAVVVGANKEIDTIAIAEGGLKIGSGAGTAVTATAVELNEAVLNLDIADGSAEAVYYVVSPHAGTISKIWSVIDAAVATADITITAAIGATPVTNGVVTIATAASAAGDIDSATPSAANTVTAGQAINFTVTGGGAGGTPRVHVAIVITR